ncbi:MAG: 16S rRNA (guanine(966)-N(2))-methyltransferase RsmD [Defluviitaleaceae bacterium]|nr:16S rRNA (guanine(966)-N(2))-methyltransferase RsmD [Defluviitaleaceae bacterium]
MRVIAGSARRVALVAPEGLDTRPTSDRAKESLFSILGEEIIGARVLDIFCGSGAIGIEALSRGAAKVVFVDNAMPAIAATSANLAKTRLTPKGEVFCMKAAQAINKLEAESQRFEIIFIDPPYGTELLTGTLENLAHTNLLSDDGLIIAETDARERPVIPQMYTLVSTRIYGRTKFLFLYIGE